MANNVSTTSLEKQAALRRQLTPRTTQPPAAVPPIVLQRAVADPGATRPSEILTLQRRYGNQAVQHLLARHTVQPKLNVGPAGDLYEREADRVAGQVLTMAAPQAGPGQPAVQRQAEEAEVPTKPLASSITPLLQRQPQVQRVTAPNFKKKYTLPEAAATLKTSRTDGSENGVIGGWIGYIIQKLTPAAGPVKSTYVSSFDTAKGGFSASRSLPDVPDLVVHAHYQKHLDTPDTAKVNAAQVKWSDKEEGDAPPGQTKIPAPTLTQMLGATHDKDAVTHWNSNPKRHELRAKAKQIKANKDWNKDKDKSLWGEGDVPDWFS